jgi:nitrate reductase beta subunit
LVQVFLGTSDEEGDWKTEFNEERDYTKGWIYEKDGQLHWTLGQSGHFIYQQLMNTINEHIENWVFEYALMNLD